MTWATGVIAGIGAPRSLAAFDALWAWSNTETAPFPLMRWFNPLNTTQKWPGSRDSGAQPGSQDVQIYASLRDGIDATAHTLLTPVAGVLPNGYDVIAANLRKGLPRQRWSNACRQLETWGTGCTWIARGFPPMPAVPIEHPQTVERRVTIVASGKIKNLFIRGTDHALFQNRFDGTSWSGWKRLGGVLSRPSIEAIASDSGEIDLFVTGVDASGAIGSDGGTFVVSSSDLGVKWSAFQSLGGKGDGLIAVGQPSSVALDLAAVTQAAQDAAAAAHAAQTSAASAAAGVAKIESALSKAGTDLTQA